MKQKILITGINGSCGRYLANYIYENYTNYIIYGFTRWKSKDNFVEKKYNIYEVDLQDFSSVINALYKIKPNIIFHLASHANVRTSFITPNVVLNNNIIGTSNLFEAIKFLKIDPIIQLCSTSEIYGNVKQENIPIKETCPIEPASPYAVSKTCQDLIGNIYFQSYGQKIIRTRMFTYINPLRSDLFATNFALQIARIEQGLQKTLLHGNLDSIRTIIDVRDAVRAYWVAIEKCIPGDVYNIGGKETKSVKEILDMLINKSNIKIKTKLDKNLLRPNDVTLQIPCVDKFINQTGWIPIYTLEESLDFLLDHCRKIVKYKDN